MYIIGSTKMPTLEALRGLMPLWLNAQRPMHEVVRWGNFPDYGQTLLMHANSFPVLGRYVTMMLIEQGCQLDEIILMDAFMLHDHGEPPTGGDEHDGNKTANKPEREWEAFWAMTESVSLPIRSRLRKAFALQYCRKDWNTFALRNNDNLIPELCLSYGFEAAVFEFCERLDYLMSALEGFGHGVRNEVETMIEHTLTRQIPKLDLLVEEFSHLGSVWTPQLREEFLSLTGS